MAKYIGQHSGSSKDASDGMRGERSKPFDPASRQPASVDEKFNHPEMGKTRTPSARRRYHGDAELEALIER